MNMSGKAKSKPDPQPRRVLIVDDDISVSEYLDVAIKSAGHQTVLAYDGESALQKFRQGGADLIILDALIPKVDGFEVCRAEGRRTNGHDQNGSDAHDNSRTLFSGKNWVVHGLAGQEASDYFELR